jgi:hypothetical protein
VETPAVETPAVETPAVETPAVETPAVETPAVETPAVEETAKAIEETDATPEATVAIAEGLYEEDEEDTGGKICFIDPAAYREFHTLVDSENPAQDYLRSPENQYINRLLTVKWRSSEGSLRYMNFMDGWVDLAGDWEKRRGELQTRLLQLLQQPDLKPSLRQQLQLLPQQVGQPLDE